jgi:hypothetical protein
MEELPHYAVLSSNISRLENVVMFTLRAPSWSPWLRLMGTTVLVLGVLWFLRRYGI